MTRTKASARPHNDEIAEALDRVADLLEAQHASVYRVRAYRGGARFVRELEEPLAQRVRAEDENDLESLPGIGRSLASAIRELVRTGRLRLLERLEGQTSAHELFSTVPGIGEDLAERIEGTLHIETLEELEQAAYDGRLESVPGFGPRRVRGIRDSLARMLRYAGSRRALSRRSATASRQVAEGVRPSVALLLEIDAEYREAAEQGTLRTIAPRRFNPEHRAWLPVMHREREGWTFTALFSNTARAHRLDRTRDWVVIYAERDGVESQCTVVTEHAGDLAGHRVVRGREAECREHAASALAGLEPSGERAADGEPSNVSP